MEELKPIQGTRFNEQTLDVLGRARIKDVKTFMLSSNFRIHRLTKLSIKEVLHVKNVLREKYTPNSLIIPKINEIKNKDVLCKTGIDDLDKLIFCKYKCFSSFVLEICGKVGIGKTTFCYFFALKCLLVDKLSNVLYIDTKNDFRAEVFIKLLKNQQLFDNEIEAISKRLIIKSVYSLPDVIRVLEYILSNSNANNFRLIIIDSIPAVWHVRSGMDICKGIYLLYKLGELAKKISFRFNIVVVFVNLTLEKRKFVSKLCFNLKNLESNPIKIQPAMGRHWLRVPNQRIIMESSTEVEDRAYLDHRIIRIIKSPVLSLNAQCSVILNKYCIMDSNYL